MGVSWILITIVICAHGNSGQQYFRVKPQDTSVVVGRTAELHCFVGNRAGSVQWSKDGFLLGYDPGIPGYARYEMQVDDTKSAYTLLVHDVRLDDEGEFQCQVGPGKGQKPIRSVARLTVLVPPSSLSINDKPNGSDVNLGEGEKVILTCAAGASKPATILKWFRKNIELMPEASKTTVRREGEKLYTTLSSITLYPKGDPVSYWCEALHPALDVPLKTLVSVRVLFPPGFPVIEGYREGELIQSDDHLTLTCTSKGGKPAAVLNWYRNHDLVSEGHTFIVGDDATNTITLKISPSENNVAYTCSASNPLIVKPLLKTVKLNVVFPPNKVVMTGPSTAFRGDVVLVQCRTDISNPPAEIRWRVDGHPVENHDLVANEVEQGWIVTSNFTSTLSRQAKGFLKFTCSAFGIPRRKVVSQNLNITVIYPPEVPQIFGYNEDQPLREGQLQLFTCEAVSGYPPASIRWHRGDNEEMAKTSLVDGKVHSSVYLQIQRTDNGLLLRCEVNSSLLQEPLSSTVKLQALFPPKNASITIKPAQPREGEDVRLVCWTDSSNPPSKVTWFRNGGPLASGSVQTLSSDYDGWSTGHIVQVDGLTSEDDGSTVSCEARNDIFNDSVQAHATLRVRYAPKFVSYERVMELVEGYSGSFNSTAKSHPPVRRYAWFRDGEVIVPPHTSTGSRQRRIIADGPVLLFNPASRQDAGEYTCVAENEEASSTQTMSLDVLYPALAFNITGQTTTLEGEMASMECSADANPVSENTIFWRRRDSGKFLPFTVPEIGRSVLTIINVSRLDAGIIECVADNRIGNPSVSVVRLEVLYRPTVLWEQLKHNVVVGTQNSAELECGAEGHPEVTFTWSFNGTAISTGPQDTVKYSNHLTKRRNQQWWSRLEIRDLDQADFGEYACVARNQLGYDYVLFTISSTGVPEPPRSLQVLNITDHSALLCWEQGFDGGATQSFTLRYRQLRDPDFTFVQIASNTTSYLVQGLRQDTPYEFAIAALNEVGQGAFTKDVAAKTKSLPVMDSTASLKGPLDEDFTDGSFPLWILTGVILGIVGISSGSILFAIYVRHKKNRGTARNAAAAETTSQAGVKEKNIQDQISSGLVQKPAPFYLSGTRVSLSEEDFDLKNFQKSPTQVHVPREFGEDGPSSRVCRECGGRKWGSNLITGVDPGHGTIQHLHEQYPDILKRDVCHCDTVEKSIFLSENDNNSGQEERHLQPLVLTTFQSKPKVEFRSTFIGPRLETVINGHDDDS